ncbi:Hypothetical_protein [Hexamita inflata]|uniref:Hypothetical_protein n=1 Tax=Hexamita inflata TaxID=28002 RepID=A0AA86R657_9EUKA|nr:Hypothetical protein HINF_LOCUS24042 [Hexamita inflata]CAI9966978.1 Hypothetical protein HINF_LOCUS54623 [Hexamita inflata]
MNFFQKLQTASTSTSKLTKQVREIQKMKKKQNIQRLVSNERRVDLDKGFCERKEFDDNLERQLQLLALKGAQQFVYGVEKLQEKVIEKDNIKPAQSETVNVRTTWKVLQDDDDFEE